MSNLPEQPPESRSRDFAPISNSAATRTHTNGSRMIHHTDTHLSHKETRDPNLDVNLPYRTLSGDANLDEYTSERPEGEIDGKLEPDGEHHYKLVTFTPNDPENPKNWSKAFKWYCTMVVATTCFVVAFCSSVVTADMIGVEKEFGVVEEIALISISIFVVGFGIGPMVFAPLSEVLGRRIIYGTTLLVAVIFIIPCAVATNIQTLLVCRAIDGIAFSAPMTLVGGTLADLWKTEERGVPMAAFSAAPFIGPAIGPLIGGFLSDAVGWRWLYWIQLIFAGVVYVLITFTVPETYAPTILAKRAKKLRESTGQSDHVTEQDLDMRPFSERLRIFLIRPFQLLFGEPIVFMVSLYMSVLYGLLYMFFVAFPIVYQGGKGYSAGITGLMFIPLALGVLGSAACAPLVNRNYMSQLLVHPHRALHFRLVLVPGAQLGRAAIGGFPVGFGFIFLYNSANNYLVDSYQHLAASALAAKTFLRSFWGAAVVLFTAQMYKRLGYQWASSLLAFISLACCGIPFVFWFYGARIRKRSKFAFSDPTKDVETGAVSGEGRASELELERARSYVSVP
ncbi:putative MFS-type transporter [Lachnellula occidentalis]|uniref:Putative MFS-type transporter n=1 Tax=Lachnellula occidentalis TaxID=215460 RepID=A0A8H8U4Z4_9HELO|nr:putative MFS-type transporter [Lachnellula occidentalis]